MIDINDITETIVEPLNLAVIKNHLRVDGNENDGYIEGLITAARVKAEQVTGLSLVPHTFELEESSNDGEIELLYPPVASIDSVQYWDGSEFVTDDSYTSGGLNTKYVLTTYKRVKITYTTKAEINEDLKRLMMDLIQVWFDNRPDMEQIQETIVKRMAKYKVWRVL